jgi:integrase/recombinase XerD
MSKLAPTLQAFFTDRLMGQRQASPHTIAGYRDTFRLLLRFATERTRTPASDLDFADLDAPLIGAFLTHLETERGNGVRTRNHRLAAIHSLFGYAALHHPEHAASIQRVLAIPPKRFERNLITFLTDDEVDALLAACDRSTWTGRRDHAMTTLAIQTGLRVSELTGLTCADVVLGGGAHVRCLGKGRKQRHTPLLPLTVAVLRAWLTERHGNPTDPLFPTRTGRALSRDAIERRITLHVRTAAQACPSLRTKKISATPCATPPPCACCCPGSTSP